MENENSLSHIWKKESLGEVQRSFREIQKSFRIPKVVWKSEGHIISPRVMRI